MAKTDNNLEVVKVTKYFFRKKGEVDTQEYDWIGSKCKAGLYPVELKGKMGFANNDGKIIIPIIYDRPGYSWNGTVDTGDHEKYLLLKKNGQAGLLRNDGTPVLEFEWTDINLSDLSEDLVPVKNSNGWGYANIVTGKTQIEPAYQKARWFKNGIAPVALNDKWGMIDKEGNLITECKYLLDTHFFGDFAIALEGGTWEDYGRSIVIHDSNCKIINKKGIEIVTDCSWIYRFGIDVFSIERIENNRKIKSTKQFIAFPEHIVVIEDGVYLSGYLTPEVEYSPDDYAIRSADYPKAKYIGGGKWSAIDYEGNPITIPITELEKVKESLLAN